MVGSEGPGSVGAAVRAVLRFAATPFAESGSRRAWVRCSTLSPPVLGAGGTATGADWAGRGGQETAADVRGDVGGGDATVRSSATDQLLGPRGPGLGLRCSTLSPPASVAGGTTTGAGFAPPAAVAGGTATGADLGLRCSTLSPPAAVAGVTATGADFAPPAAGAGGTATGADLRPLGPCVAFVL